MLATLRGSRLLLRPLSPGDGDFWCEIYTDAELMRAVAPPLHRSEAERSFAAALSAVADPQARGASWVLESLECARLLGLIGLIADAPLVRAQEAELGALIVPREQARGRACEAITVLAAHAFERWPLRRLHTRHAPENAGAAGLMRRLGFTPLPAASGERLAQRWELRRPAIAMPA